MSIHYPSGQGPVDFQTHHVSKATSQYKPTYSKRGMSLEEEINESNQYYLATHQAVIHKKPTPIQLVKVDYPKRSAAVIREAYFRRPSTTDYNGIYKGFYIDFDAKETRNKRSFPLKNFHQHQINHLMDCVAQGGICFAFIKFTSLDLLYLLPATKLFKYWQDQKNGGKSSITLTAIKKDGIKVEYGLNPRLQYLPAIDQLITIYKKEKSMNNDEFPSSREDDFEENEGRGPLVKKILLWVVGIIVLLIISGAALFFFWASSAPKISRNELASQSTTTIYDANNKVVSRLGAQKRQYAKSSDIPDNLKHAVVSIEDRRFYKNHGVDPTRIFGAALNNVFHRSDGTQGGSTLTQQLVKLSVFSTAASDRTFKRKAQEAWLAINVDRNFSKNEILEFYINKVYMGNGVYGMKTAAQYYYGKDLDELSLAQIAMLAGIPQSPTYYNPAVKDTQAATVRRNQVLNAMVRSKYISQAQANSAKQEPVTKGLDDSHGNTKSNDVNVKEPVVDAYVKEVLSQLEQKGYNPQTDGLQVHTNMDLGAQQKLYYAANNSVSFQSNQMQTGVAVTNPHNGQVVAMLGGRHTGGTIYGLNRAVQTNRSSGSTAKPLMDYGPAIEYLNWPTFYTLKDTKFTWPGTNTELHDFDNQTKGTMTMQDALVQSRNIPAIRALQKVGVPRATTFLNGLGISQKKAFTLNNGIGLYVSPLQVASAYAAFANGGTYYKPYYISSITTQDGKSINYGKDGKRAMSKATAYMITYMLKGVIDSSEGTGNAAHISGVHQAGKTGTTNYPSGHSQSGVMDSWMAGYTKNYSVAVWTGYDQPMKNSISSAYERSAIMLYRAIMDYLDGKNHAGDWRMPDTVEAVRYRGRKGLVVKDSKWALQYTAIDDDDDSSNESSSSSSSSNGALSSSVSSYFESRGRDRESSSSTTSTSASANSESTNNSPSTQPSNNASSSQNP